MAEPLSHSRPAGVERLADKIDKPLLDDRSYRVIKLPNQLEALLIHDADTDKASAAMDVNVGSFSDVKELPGIAHAVEHLLFMGTEKVGRAIILYNNGTSLITISYSTPARTSTTPT
jgi:insulysin